MRIKFELKVGVAVYTVSSDKINNKRQTFIKK